ncbi:hypothetical protein ACFJIV_12430 [Mucilaginibacter sp. UC70_90]
MSQKTIIQNAREYVYDLRNTANENGLKDSDTWQLSLVSGSEKKTLEKSYQPTVVIALLPDVIKVFITEVKAAMNRADAAFNRIGNLDLKTNEMQFLVAYNNKRARR